MIKRLPSLLCVLFFVALLAGSCSSGKTAYKHGDYYDAVLAAVERLRHSPDNKKSKEVLSLSYQSAVDFLNTDAQNQIASNANQKWRSVVNDYSRINNLYENIRTSPGALKVISSPVNKYKELTVAKDSAAAECYAAALQSMLKNTRDDAKQAYFLFTDANTFSPGYRESIEMLQQAKYNATLKVVVEGTSPNNFNWNFDQIIYGTTVNQFVKFYSPQQATAQKLDRVDHRLRVAVNGYDESKPYLNRTNQNYTDSVTNGEKTVNGQKKTLYRRINGSMTIYEKQINVQGSVLLNILDNSNNAQLANTNVVSQFTWRDQWAQCSGDQRAIPSKMSPLCNKSENYPAGGQLIGQTKKDLDDKLVNAIGQFYKNY